MRQTVLLTIGFILACSQLFSQASDSDAHTRMRQLEDFSKGVDTAKLESQRSRIPLWLGPDDDPTLAADVSQHEAPPAARKLASRAEHFSKKQQHEKAIAEFQRALELDHQYYEAENNLAIEYFTAGQTDSAIHTLKHLTEAEPKRVLAFDNLAIILCSLQRYPEAEVFAFQAYKLHPFSYKAAYVFGSSLVNQGKRTPEARQALRYASEKHPEANELLARWPKS